jgi:UDP-N-acetylmuramyl tripeptide synthase
MSDFKIGNSTAATEMNNYPNLDMEETNIQEAIAQFYMFFGRMVRLRNDIDLLALDDLTKNRILDQLEDIESEWAYSVAFGV